MHGDLYQNLSFDEVVMELIKQKEVVKKKDAHIRELEDYIDDLLVRVMEETPSILRNPYEPTKKAEKKSWKLMYVYINCKEQSLDLN